jgi:hypothetical protein
MTRLLLALASLFLTSIGGCVVHVGGGGTFQLDQRAERVETHALELAPGETLSLDTDFGRIEVDAAEGARPELRATIRAHGRTKEEAEAVLARYAVEIERGPQGPSARLSGEPLRLREGGSSTQLSASVDFVATVPAGTRLRATSGSGAIRASGALDACHLETDFGAIEVEGARGEVHAESGSGSVTARRVRGTEVVLESDFGAIRVEDVEARSLACDSGSGQLTLEGLRADDARLSTDFGAIAVDGVLAGLNAETGSGSVHVEARDGSRVDPGWTLRSDFGSVTLHVPASFGCRLDARTDFGSVSSDFPVRIEAGKNREKTLVGTVGDGGGPVKLASGSGSVALRKL